MAWMQQNYGWIMRHDGGVVAPSCRFMQVLRQGATLQTVQTVPRVTQPLLPTRRRQLPKHRRFMSGTAAAGGAIH